MIPRGFIKFRRDAVGASLRERVKGSLTIAPISTSSFSSEQVIIRMWFEEGDQIGIPRGFFNQYLKGKYVEDYQYIASMGGNPMNALPPIALRPGQPELIEKAIEEIRKYEAGGAIMEAKTGAGKTVLGLETARRLGLKTLVVVHTSILADQWEKEIHKFFPSARVGRLQAEKIDIKDKDIVIGMLQSTSMKEYPVYLYEEFGTIIYDEVHKLGAPEFSKGLGKFTPKYLIGLSGTLTRADRAENVFIHGIGKILSGMKDIAVLDPEVYFVDTQFSWTNLLGDDQALDRQKPQFLKSIVNSDVRNEILIRQAFKASQAERNVLILSERVAHVEYLASRLKKLGVDVGCLVGTTPKGDREKNQQCQVVCATNQLVGTGFNEPRLDMLILASPIQGDLIQASGRIRRLHPGKKKPLIIDPVDSNSHIGLVLGMARRKRYMAQGWKMNGTDVFKRKD